MTLRLTELEAPLEDVEFPGGARHQPVPFGPTEYKQWREAQASTDTAFRDAAATAILRACYPTVTDDEWACITPKMGAALIALAAGKIDMVRDALKNVERPDDPEGPAASPAKLPPSSPSPSGSTSSRKSPRKRAGSGGMSTTANPTASPT